MAVKKKPVTRSVKQKPRLTPLKLRAQSRVVKPGQLIPSNKGVPSP